MHGPRYGMGDSGYLSQLIRLILGLWGSKVRQNGKFPALDADKLLCKI